MSVTHLVVARSLPSKAPDAQNWPRNPIRTFPPCLGRIGGCTSVAAPHVPPS